MISRRQIEEFAFWRATYAVRKVKEAINKEVSKEDLGKLHENMLLALMDFYEGKGKKAAEQIVRLAGLQVGKEQKYIENINSQVASIQDSVHNEEAAVAQEVIDKWVEDLNGRIHTETQEPRDG